MAMKRPPIRHRTRLDNARLSYIRLAPAPSAPWPAPVWHRTRLARTCLARTCLAHTRLSLTRAVRHPVAGFAAWLVLSPSASAGPLSMSPRNQPVEY